jgi:arylsulfatase A-like enzyme
MEKRPFSLKFIFSHLFPLKLPIIGMVLVAVIFSTIEGFISFQISGRPNKLPNISDFFLFFSIWFFVLLMIHFIWNLGKKIPGILLKIIYYSIPSLAVFYLVLFSIFSWICKSRTGYFVSYELVSFSLNNFQQLLLHFFQTFPGLIVGLFFLSAVPTFIIIALPILLEKLNKNDKNNVSKLIIAVSVIIALYNVHTKGRNELHYTTHPLISLVISSNNQNFDNNNQVFLESNPIPKDKQNSLSTYHRENPVIVIMIESLRRDLVFLEPSPLPFLKSLSHESIFFDKAYAAASHSNYADISVWYSLYTLKTKYFAKYPKDREVRGKSIYSIFKKMKYHTAYISSQNEKWGNMINWLDVPEIDYFYHSEDYYGSTWYNKHDQAGLMALIKKKIATAGKIEDTETIKIGKKWIDSLKQKNNFFLGLNLQNTHFNYVIPEGGAEPFKPDSIDFPTVYYAWPRSQVENVRNRYLNAVFNVDSIIKDFVSYLKAKGIWDNCYFIIIGDSGEAFYEHDFGNHSGPMYDEVMRTFCIIKTPHSKNKYIENRPISHIDLMPILLDLMEIPKPFEFQGISIIKSDEQRPVFMYSDAFVEQDGMICWPYKFLLTRRPIPKIELYNLEKDPEEKNNLSVEEKDLMLDMAQPLRKWRKMQLSYYSNNNFYLNFYPPQTHFNCKSLDKKR